MLWYCFTRKLLTTGCRVALELRINAKKLLFLPRHLATPVRLLFMAFFLLSISMNLIHLKLFHKLHLAEALSQHNGKIAIVLNSSKLTCWFCCSNNFLNCALSDLIVWLTSIYFLPIISVHTQEKSLGEFVINRSPKDRCTDRLSNFRSLIP